MVPSIVVMMASVGHAWLCGLVKEKGGGERGGERVSNPVHTRLSLGEGADGNYVASYLHPDNPDR